MQPCNIVIADTNIVYRHGLTALIEKHFTNCTIAEVADANALLCVLRESCADVILAPVNLLQQEGFTVIQQLLQQHNHLRIILYAAHRNEQLMLQAFVAGAAAFFYSDEPVENIIYKTEQVLQFGCCITPDTFNAYKTAHNQQNDKQLTRREKEILQWVEKGNTTQQIAQLLYLSNKTVQNHRNNILRKTGCHNMAQALQHVKQYGM
jgi:DNA-binding NarL/FixJ family response regulator